VELISVPTGRFVNTPLSRRAELPGGVSGNGNQLIHRQTFLQNDIQLFSFIGTLSEIIAQHLNFIDQLLIFIDIHLQKNKKGLIHKTMCESFYFVIFSNQPFYCKK